MLPYKTSEFHLPPRMLHRGYGPFLDFDLGHRLFCIDVFGYRMSLWYQLKSIHICVIYSKPEIPDFWALQEMRPLGIRVH